MSSLRLALVVQGRFYMFDLARELIRQGHDVTLFTNYPKRVCAGYGVPHERVIPFVTHGIGSRVLTKLLPRRADLVERWTNTAFGRWAAGAVHSRGPWDAITCMTGIAEDLFVAAEGTGALRVLERASVHIREQKRILSEEERIGGGFVEQPSNWIIAREEREYEMADIIHVPTLGSFLAAGLSPTKLELLPLGVDVSAFTPTRGTIDARCRRLSDGDPLRVICAGTFSRRKGARCWSEMLEELSAPGEYRFVGTIVSDAVNIARSLRNRVDFRAKVPQADLAREYAWADLFMLPTLEDGFAVVVAQALASGLPVVTTASCGASALIDHGSTGWIVAAGQADKLTECIRSLDANRSELVAAVHRLSHCEFSRDWANVATSFAESILRRRQRSLSLAENILHE